MNTTEQNIIDLEGRYHSCRRSALRAERKGNTRGARRFIGLMVEHQKSIEALCARREKIPSNRARELVHARIPGEVKTRFVGTAAGHHRFLCELTGFIYAVDFYSGTVSTDFNAAVIDDIADGTLVA